MKWETVRYPFALGGGIKLGRVDEGRQTPKPIRHWSVPGHFYLHLYNCRAELTVNGVKLPVRPGYVGVIPAGARVADKWFGLSSHLFAQFAEADPGSRKVYLPAMQDMSGRFEGLAERFKQAIACFHTEPERATAKVCDLLWDISDAQPTVKEVWSDCPNEAVRRVCGRVEALMGGKLTVAMLAMSVDVTPDYLTRLFRRHMGVSVLEYIRKRRVERARQLLVHSSLPVKAVGAQVGMADPHVFNKVVRRELGRSPSAVRERGER